MADKGKENNQRCQTYLSVKGIIDAYFDKSSILWLWKQMFLFNQHSYSNTKVFVYDVCLLRIDESLFEDQTYVSLSIEGTPNK